MANKMTFLSLLLFFAYGTLMAQADRVLGYWLTEDGDSQVEIFKSSGGQYYGRVVWLEEPLNDAGRPKVDDQNPDRARHNTPIIGLEILKGYSYNSSREEWSGGTIYDPKNGRTYTAYMRLEDHQTLRIRGYVMGMRFMGRTTHWVRESVRRE